MIEGVNYPNTVQVWKARKSGPQLCGLFTLYAMFSDRSLFSGHIAASPAVPFGNRFAFKQESEFAASKEELPVKLFVEVGSDEQLTSPVKEYMKTMASRNQRSLKLESRVIEGERHASNKPEAYNRGLRFLFAAN